MKINLNVLLLSSALMAFAYPNFAQKSKSTDIVHEIGILPIRYQFTNKFIHQNNYWQASANAYYLRYNQNSNWAMFAMLDYAYKRTNDDCKDCFDSGESDFTLNRFTLTLAPRYTIGQSKQRMFQPYLQPGIFLGNETFKGGRYGGGWGAENYNRNALVFGFDLRVGLRAMINHKISFSILSGTQLGWELYKNNIKPEEASVLSNNTVTIPLQIGLGIIL